MSLRRALLFRCSQAQHQSASRHTVEQLQQQASLLVQQLAGDIGQWEQGLSARLQLQKAALDRLSRRLGLLRYVPGPRGGRWAGRY